jgi:uncharacterized protein YjbJ (UPF0337 family)
MNKAILEGKWRQMRGRLKDTWGDLTDDELDQISGSYDRLIGKLEEKYGYTRQEAESKVNELLDKVEEAQSA